MDGITGVFIAHAASIAMMHYRERSFLDAALYLLKKNNFVCEVICKLILNLQNSFVRKIYLSLDVILSTHILCKDVWKRFQLLPLHLVGLYSVPI